MLRSLVGSEMCIRDRYQRRVREATIPAMANSTAGSGKPQYDLLIKLLLIGDSGVGKSCLLCRYSENIFNNKFITTIGIDFKIRTIELDGKKIKLQIWDTAGQERFRTITQAYYRGAMGILLVYDVTDEKSFKNIQSWMRNIDTHANTEVVKVLLGNKCDMTNRRAVSHQQGQDLAKGYDIEFFETSAKDKINVEEAFTRIAQLIKDKRKDGEASQPDPKIDLKNQPVQKKKGGCC
eukprot:TRINITY_DN197_c0_g2_i1.p1 TRINITY_DN197_c0_g2~~TRINITY_DN197_c0_g2_i1.p1  ORF type:complete len:277 (-),score=97.38 TRINITY_DN197_c0_g2_i1:159-866(-)